MKYFLLITLVTLFSKSVTPQLLRPPYNFRPIGEKIIETNNFINQPAPTVISEPPCNNLIPIPNTPTPSTTIITDCSPTVCQNLANTIQLMIVCNLLQNSKSSDLALQLASPLLNEVMNSPVLSCGCNNPLSPTISTSFVAPNIGAPNVVSTNYIPPNIVNPNIYLPNPGNPLLVPTPNVVSPSNIVSLPPRVVASAPCSNSPQINPANVNGLLSTIMGMLGNIQS